MSSWAWRTVASLAFAAGSLAGTHAFAAIGVDLLSSRPELVSGGDVLVRATGVTAAPPVTVNGAAAMVDFKSDGKGGWVGLIGGLKDGDNTVVVGAAPDQMTLKLVNHGINAPIFSGPQQTPFYCELTDNAIQLKAAPGA